MPKGISLHIGLNTVDPAHYGGWDGQLVACEFDAKDMQALAKKQGFSPQMLLTPQATAAAVQSAILSAAAQLNGGDYFLLTYSGHGGQVPDKNNDETDPQRQDETWVLFDRELVDDELHSFWTKFKAGVRIFVLSDSCHSGTVTKAMPPRNARRPRLMPPLIAARTYKAHRALYDKIQKDLPAAEKAKVKASVLLISGCQDNQTSADGDRNGLFTEKLRKVWANGKFKGGYQRFRDKIVSTMPDDQTPNFFRAGAANPAFEGQKPFTI